jgi:tryptophan halogenase
MKVLVVGGGTAGLVSALILKKHLNITVDIVHSKNIGIIGVGEGSTEHFSDFMKFVGISQYEIIKECDATYKAGIMYEGWTKNTYVHSVATPFNSKVGQYNYVYANQISKKSDYMHPSIIFENNINSWFFNKNENSPYNQYHFNTFKLNSFLIKKAKSLGINLYEDEITKINILEDGKISSINGKFAEYKYDFYIDCTGFKRLLINKIGGEWESFSKHLTMNSAIVFPTEDEENYSLCTLAKTMDAGWRFRIPVWGRHGNGYIFNDSYISIEEAKQEVQKSFNEEIQFGKEFKFDPGKLKKVWINNCVAIGLSGSFVEPLEASSIGTSIQQSFLLMHKLINYNKKTIESYNKSFDDIMYNIRDFIFLHYMINKSNTKFWQDISTINPPDTLKSNLDLWLNKLPISEDFNNLSDYILFRDFNYIMVGYGVGIFNIENVKKEYSFFPDIVKESANKIIEEQKNIDNTANRLSHKKFINLVRDNF